jgi:hypothetical protein
LPKIRRRVGFINTIFMRFLKVTLFWLGLILTSCAKLPVESTAITQYLIDEGAKMHRMNIHLVNTMFKEKQGKIDQFISEEYTPTRLDNFLKNVEDTSDLREAIKRIRSKTIPDIISYRNARQVELEAVRILVISDLEENYSHYREMAEALKKLINSAVKVDKERKKLYDQLKEYSNNKLDMNALEAMVDSYLPKAGDTASKLSELLLKLEERNKK